jgi:ribosomal protein S27E
MNKREVKTELFCDKCMNDSIHTIVYINEVMHKVKCDECGKTSMIHDHLIKEISGEFIERVLTKPKRIKKEVENDPSHAISSLPSRIISKPYRIYKEFKGLRKYIYQKKKAND